MKKKIIALTLALSMAFSFAACGSPKKTPSSNDKGFANFWAPADEEDEDIDDEDEDVDSEEDEYDEDVDGDLDDEDAAYTLQELIDSEAMQKVLADLNAKAAESGISISFSADGDIFVYECQLPDSDAFNEIEEDAAAELFDPVIDELVSPIFSFENDYGITVDSVYFVIYAADGTEIYSADVYNETE